MITHASKGRPKEMQLEDMPRKFLRIYEDDDTVETWKFDLNKFERGPIEVDIKWKNGLDKPKNWNKMQREAKNERRSDRQMKKINEKAANNKGKKSKTNTTIKDRN
jgi:hypothetical protein